MTATADVTELDLLLLLLGADGALLLTCEAERELGIDADPEDDHAD